MEKLGNRQQESQKEKNNNATGNLFFSRTVPGTCA